MPEILFRAYEFIERQFPGRRFALPWAILFWPFRPLKKSTTVASIRIEIPALKAQNMTAQRNALGM